MQGLTVKVVSAWLVMVFVVLLTVFSLAPSSVLAGPNNADGNAESRTSDSDGNSLQHHGSNTNVGDARCLTGPINWEMLEATFDGCVDQTRDDVEVELLCDQAIAGYQSIATCFANIVGSDSTNATTLSRALQQIPQQEQKIVADACLRLAHLQFFVKGRIDKSLLFMNYGVHIGEELFNRNSTQFAVVPTALESLKSISNALHRYDKESSKLFDRLSALHEAQRL